MDGSKMIPFVDIVHEEHSTALFINQSILFGLVGVIAVVCVTVLIGCWLLSRCRIGSTHVHVETDGL